MTPTHRAKHCLLIRRKAPFRFLYHSEVTNHGQNCEPAGVYSRAVQLFIQVSSMATRIFVPLRKETIQAIHAHGWWWGRGITSSWTKKLGPLSPNWHLNPLPTNYCTMSLIVQTAILHPPWSIYDSSLQSLSAVESEREREVN